MQAAADLDAARALLDDAQAAAVASAITRLETEDPTRRSEAEANARRAHVAAVLGAARVQLRIGGGSHALEEVYSSHPRRAAQLAAVVAERLARMAEQVNQLPVEAEAEVEAALRLVAECRRQAAIFDGLAKCIGPDVRMMAFAANDLAAAWSRYADRERARAARGLAGPAL